MPKEKMTVEIYVENVDNFLQNLRAKNYVNGKRGGIPALRKKKDGKKSLMQQAF